MGFVMVPVPEEHVEEAMQMVLRITSRARLVDWDQDSLGGLFQEVDELTRSVLSAVARASTGGKSMADKDLADSIELTQREVLGIAREANERAQSDSRSPLIAVQQDVEVLPNGRTRERRVLSMEPEVAELVQVAERAEMKDAPHPLLSDHG